jgi:hypothetical protein
MKPKTDSPFPEQTSRRQFAKSVAATLVAAPLAAAAVKGQTPARAPEAKAPPAPPAAAAAAPPKPSPLAEAYMNVARARFGEKLTPEQLEQVRKDLEGNVRSSDRLRAVKLKNGDEPDFVFIAG